MLIREPNILKYKLCLSIHRNVMCMVRKEPYEQFLRKIEEDAFEYEKKYHGCSQCVLRALQDHLNLGDGDAFKAASAFAGGIGSLGETCGALTGGIMAIGLAVGRDKLEDSTLSSRYQKAMELTRELHRRFKKEFGSVKCWSIQKTIFGRHFGISAEPIEFIRAGGYEECPKVVKKAARIAGEIILRERSSASDKE